MKNPLREHTLQLWFEIRHGTKLIDRNVYHEWPSRSAADFGDPTELPRNPKQWDNFIAYEIVKNYGSISKHDDATLYNLYMMNTNDHGKSTQYWLDASDLDPADQNLFHEAMARYFAEKEEATRLLKEKLGEKKKNPLEEPFIEVTRIYKKSGKKVDVTKRSLSFLMSGLPDANQAEAVLFFLARRWDNIRPGKGPTLLADGSDSNAVILLTNLQDPDLIKEIKNLSDKIGYVDSDSISFKKNPLKENEILVNYAWENEAGQTVDAGVWGRISNELFQSWGDKTRIETRWPFELADFILANYGDPLIITNKLVKFKGKGGRADRNTDKQTGEPVKRRYILNFHNFDPIMTNELLQELASRCLPEDKVVIKLNPILRLNPELYPHGMTKEAYERNTKNYISAVSRLNKTKEAKAKLALAAHAVAYFLGMDFDWKLDDGGKNASVTFGETPDFSVGLRGCQVLSIEVSPEGSVIVSPEQDYDNTIQYLEEDDGFLDHFGVDFRMYCEVELPKLLKGKWVER